MLTTHIQPLYFSHKKIINNWLLIESTIFINLLYLQDLICSVTDIMETKKTNTVRVAITVTELLRFYVPRNNQTINI